jgi:hypothetical protein
MNNWWPGGGDIMSATSAHELDAKLRSHLTLLAARDTIFRDFLSLLEKSRANGIHLELGFKSWPSYFVDLTGGKLPKLRPAERRELVTLLASGTGMSDVAIGKALGVGYSTVMRDLAINPVARRDTTGLDGKTYPASKVKGRHQPPVPIDRKAAKLKSAAQGLTTAVVEFLKAVDGIPPAMARVLTRRILADANAALDSLESLFEFIDQLPGDALELVEPRSSR